MPKKEWWQVMEFGNLEFRKDLRSHLLWPTIHLNAAEENHRLVMLQVSSSFWVLKLIIYQSFYLYFTLPTILLTLCDSLNKIPTQPSFPHSEPFISYVMESYVVTSHIYLTDHSLLSPYPCAFPLISVRESLLFKIKGHSLSRPPTSSRSPATSHLLTFPTTSCSRHWKPFGSLISHAVPPPMPFAYTNTSSLSWMSSLWTATYWTTGSTNKTKTKLLLIPQMCSSIAFSVKSLLPFLVSSDLYHSIKFSLSAS